mmetsp:Transcript_84927/g.245545  ORF Transcript_84927/g.245545 Transcript_84927/m.245545 type:complete len:186 (-) Transcript_84927:68-625(-)
MDLLSDLPSGSAAGRSSFRGEGARGGPPSSWRASGAWRAEEAPVSEQGIADAKSALERRDAQAFAAAVASLHGRDGVEHFRTRGTLSARGRLVAAELDRALGPLDAEADRFVAAALKRDRATASHSYTAGVAVGAQPVTLGPAGMAAVKVSSVADGWERLIQKSMPHPGLMDGCMQTTAYIYAGE